MIAMSSCLYTEHDGYDDGFNLGLDPQNQLHGLNGLTPFYHINDASMTVFIECFLLVF